MIKSIKNMDISEQKIELKELLRIEEKEKRLHEIEEAMKNPQFWQEREKAQTDLQEFKGLQEIVKNWQKADNEKALEKLSLQALLSGKYDHQNAILSIYAGAGGTEAQDWAAILLRMYERYCQSKDWQMEVLDKSPGEEAGLKSITARIVGMNAAGYLKSEAGVHRLVRLSPFDADHARHTSFALVEITPEVEKEELSIEDKDLKVDVFRSSGHGGQSVNTTDSAVRITHLPTGLVVTCQNERSQLQNKETAMKILRSKLFQRLQSEHQTQLKELRGEFSSPMWGNQIRSYVLHPYQMVKDHRTEVETSDTQGVLGGKIDQFINAYLKKNH